MSSLFESLAAKCVRLNQRFSYEDEQDATWVLQSRESGPLEGGTGSRAWHLLYLLLSRHDPDGLYRIRVLDAILIENRNTALPSWLITYFFDRQPAILLSRLLKYDLLGEALRHALSLVHRCIVRLKGATSRERINSDWFPYPVLDQMLSVPLDSDPNGPDAAAYVGQSELRRLVNDLIRINEGRSDLLLKDNRY